MRPFFLLGRSLGPRRRVGRKNVTHDRRNEKTFVSACVSASGRLGSAGDPFCIGEGGAWTETLGEFGGSGGSSSGITRRGAAIMRHTITRAVDIYWLFVYLCVSDSLDLVPRLERLIRAWCSSWKGRPLEVRQVMSVGACRYFLHLCPLHYLGPLFAPCLQVTL